MRAANNRKSAALIVRPVLLWLLAGAALNFAAARATAAQPAIPSNAASNYGWVIADLDGDQIVDVATARSGRHDLNGYSQEVRIRLGGFQQTSFRFLSRGETVELSTLDVDGDHDGDLVAFEPLSSQPIGVWLNDGAGSFHEGRVADFQKLWSGAPGPAFRGSFEQIALPAISEERIQPLAPPVINGAPELVIAGVTRQFESELFSAFNARYCPRGPPSKS